jgi:glycosyltransferase involved in cell wall biosynthesis
VSRVLERLTIRAATLIHRSSKVGRRLGRRTHPTHVAMLCDSFLRYGTAQAIGLRLAGYAVTVYYVDRLDDFGGSDEDRELFLTHVAGHGIDIVRLPRRAVRRLPAQLWSLFSDMRRRRITDVVAQAHFEPRYALSGLRYPAVLVLHDPRPHSGDTELPRWPAPMVARFAELTATCLMLHSERLATQLRPMLRAVPIITVAHGVTVGRTASPVPIEPHVLLFGRLYPYKGIEAGLEAFGRARKALPHARMTVAGRGPMAELVRRRQTEGVTLVDGYVSEEHLDEMLESATIVLLPYRDATQSGVGLLAVARGIPCVVTDEGALPELLGVLNEGFVAPADDVPRLGAAIVRGLTHDYAFREKIHMRARDTFEWATVGRDLMAQASRHGFGDPPD